MTPDYDPDIVTLTTMCGHPPVCAWSLAIHKYHRVLEYLAAKVVASVSPEALHQAMHDPKVRQTEDRLVQVAASGDEAGTNALGNTLVRAYTTALQQIRQGKAA